MKRVLYAVMLSMILMFSSGCAEFGKSSQHALSVVTTSTNLYYYYENGEVVNFLDQANLTEIELIQVIEALDQAERSKERLTLYKSQPLLVIEDITQISFQYVKIKSAYLSIRSIVSLHWSEYDEGQQQLFMLFDRYAMKLDEEFEALNVSIDSNEAIKTALALAGTAVKLSALL